MQACGTAGVGAVQERIGESKRRWEKLGGREQLEKRRGGTRLYSRWMVGLADEARSDAIPEAAGGVGGHEAAKLDSVIRRYIIYHS
jgi:hypothetical protein